MNFKRIGIPLALVAGLIVFLIPMHQLSFSGHAALALLVFAVVMWATETVPLAVTSMIILFAQPIIGVESFDNAVIGFANPIIFLMIGGFIIAEAIRKSGLAQRLTYTMLNRVGTTPSRALFCECILYRDLVGVDRECSGLCHAGTSYKGNCSAYGLFRG